MREQLNKENSRCKESGRMRMKDLSDDVGAKACTVGSIVNGRIKWAGHMVKMKDERLSKKSETEKQEGCRKEQDNR